MCWLEKCMRFLWNISVLFYQSLFLRWRMVLLIFCRDQRFSWGNPIAQVSAIATEMHFWAPGTVAVVGPYAGGTRTLDEERGILRTEVGFQKILSADAKEFHPSSLFWGKDQTGRVEGMALVGVGWS